MPNLKEANDYPGSSDGVIAALVDGLGDLITSGGVGGSGGETTLPTASSATITTLQTSATGSNFTAFSSADCSSLEVFNNSGTTVEYRRNGTGAAFPILSGTSRLVIAISNANQISVRRTDQSNTQVVIAAEIFA